MCSGDVAQHLRGGHQRMHFAWRVWPMARTSRSCTCVRYTTRTAFVCEHGAAATRIRYIDTQAWASGLASRRRRKTRIELDTWLSRLGLWRMKRRRRPSGDRHHLKGQPLYGTVRAQAEAPFRPSPSPQMRNLFAACGRTRGDAGRILVQCRVDALPNANHYVVTCLWIVRFACARSVLPLLFTVRIVVVYGSLLTDC